MFSSIPGLYPLEANNKPPPQPTHTPLQLWQPKMSPDIARSPLGYRIDPVQNHCPWTLQATMTVFEISFPLHFTLPKMLISCKVCLRSSRDRNINWVTSCPCVSLFQNFYCITVSYHKSFTDSRGSWAQMVTIIPIISTHQFKERFSFGLQPLVYRD